jgi:hypothetical protein
MTPKEVKTALKRLPKGSNALSTAYDEAIKRIESQDNGVNELAKKTLSWVVHAKRQLKATELQHASAVEIKPAVLGNGTSHNENEENDQSNELDADNIAEIEDILSACGGLVIIDEETKNVHLVHETTMEYFTQIRESWFPSAQTEITIVCLTYLFLDKPEVDRFLSFAGSKDKQGLEKTESLLFSDFLKITKETVLASYAANYWGVHAHNAEDT